MKTIHKFPLKTADRQPLTAPGAWYPISVGIQNGTLMIWAEVDNQDVMRVYPYNIAIVGTGHPFNSTGWHFIGTVFDGPFVWHVYFELEHY